jgi:cysteine desulfurase / selenocysteine lyase
MVIDSMVEYYTSHNANVHRGIHTLGDESTKLYHDARTTVAHFIGASDPEELVFVRNTTEAVNLVAFSWALKNIKANDEILVTDLEHHSNLVPWQRVCQQTGAKLLHLPIDGNGDLVLEYLKSLVGQRTKLVALTQVSNVLGTIVDIQHLVKDIKRSGSPAKFFVDAAQSVPHMPVHIHDLNVDFLVFSGHKMCGPQGIGGLWVRKNILKTMNPFLVGGGMISRVFKDHADYADLPDRFDAGTPNVAGAIGLAAACDYLSSVGMSAVRQHEIELTDYALKQFIPLEEQGIIKLYGVHDSQKRAGIITFTVNGIHAHDVAQILDREAGVAIRSGHHCNQPLMEKMNIPATCRASFYLYNTQGEIDVLIAGLHRTRQVFNL